MECRVAAILIFLTVLSAKSADVTPQPFDAIINLGGDCQVAYQLSKHGLRNYALPFDALITPYNSLKKMLQNSFEGFMTPDNFELVGSGKYILDKKYGTRLLHDFKVQEDFLKDYQEISSKYLRRISRLMDLIVTSEYPLFIRKRLAREQARELQGLLSALRQGRPFLLAALDATPEIFFDWELEGVRNFYLKQPQPYVWQGDSEAWKEIFTAVGLVTHDPAPSNNQEKSSLSSQAVIKNNRMKGVLMVFQKFFGIRGKGTLCV